ncbi:hypothetical protein J6590_002216 [Homalodisca vitripennis]|nr:hypothetical protein J6590_002216 [Homalodisca vitripennis]
MTKLREPPSITSPPPRTEVRGRKYSRLTNDQRKASVLPFSGRACRIYVAFTAWMLLIHQPYDPRLLNPLGYLLSGSDSTHFPPVSKYRHHQRRHWPGKRPPPTVTYYLSGKRDWLIPPQGVPFAAPTLLLMTEGQRNGIRRRFLSPPGRWRPSRTRSRLFTRPCQTVCTKMAGYSRVYSPPHTLPLWGRQVLQQERGVVTAEDTDRDLNVCCLYVNKTNGLVNYFEQKLSL